MSPKGRTELIIGVSEAKLHEEADFDIQRSLAPQKPGKEHEKLISETEKQNPKKRGVEKSNVGNRLKRVLAKFHGRAGLV